MENNNIYKEEPDNNSNNNSETIFSGEDFSMEGYDKYIRQARNAIFAAAGILGISIIIMAATASPDYKYLWLDVIIWCVFVAGFIALGLWTKKKPYTAIVCALVLYGLMIVLNALIDVSTIFKGILFKIVIIVLLVKGLKDAKEAQQMQDQMGK